MRLTGASLAGLTIPPTAQPLDLETLFRDLEGATGIVAAVSGGPDSTALMHLLARWAAGGDRPPVTVATLDHGLRTESAAEAEAVAEAAASLGLPHRVLVWDGPKPSSRMQERAREERYRRLAALAREISASHLATGHTLDDQAETVVMRLIAGSGIGGLAGMRPASMRDGVTLVRPFLALRKTQLLDLCHAEGWAYVQDRSNRDHRYARPRLRAGLMPALAEEGLTAERLSTLSARARRDADALDARADAVFSALRRDGERAVLTLDGLRLGAEPDAILLRVIARAIAAVGGPARTARLAAIETCVLAELRPALQARQPRRLNLGGVLIALQGDGHILFRPEPPRRAARLRTP